MNEEIKNKLADRKKNAEAVNDRIKLQLGDRIEKMLAPIVRVIDDMLDTNIKDCSGCKRRKKWLNDLTDTNKDI